MSSYSEHIEWLMFIFILLLMALMIAVHILVPGVGF